jgi:hypothetical protein
MMRRVGLALALLASMPADAAAHCHRIWRYPWPQHCGWTRPHVSLALGRRLPLGPHPVPRVGGTGASVGSAIPLPPLSFDDMIGIEPTEEQRAHMMLRGALRGPLQ